ncbi:hypothetical protein HPB52_013106 [Rhipicephalus sanguineus]|uniref:HTH psq-type domain-containing protein n=1 Tax=Rhipicephalus sanguineus TaxID=34632 RepID=A0A9D4T5L6_RHISA|nr:hypothetical protein HPB52_013106 [Rhipicephalus sanguineus]
MRVPAYDNVEEALYSWFLETWAKNIPIGDLMLMEKARWSAAAFGLDSFTGGTNWQQCFESCYSIIGKALSSESGMTNRHDMEKWLSEEWPNIRDSFSLTPCELEGALRYSLHPATFAAPRLRRQPKREGERARTVLLLSASRVARIAITAITTDREHFVGGVHFPMASVKKRKNLHFATKLKAIQRVEAGEKSSTVADDIMMPRSTMSTLLKRKADIKAKAAEQRMSGACRVCAPAHGKVEKALYAWFLEVANCFRKAGFVTAELVETGEDGDDERIDDAFRELASLFPAAVLPKVSADDFVEANCNVQAVASPADKDIVAAVAGTQDAQANSSSDEEDGLDEAAATHAYSAAEVAAAFGLIRRCCGDMEGTGLSHLDSLDKIKARRRSSKRQLMALQLHAAPQITKRLLRRFWFRASLLISLRSCADSAFPRAFTMATRGPYRTLDLATKVKILKEVEQGGTAKQDIARKYGIKPNTLSNILKNKRSVLDVFENDQFKIGADDDVSCTVGEEDTSELDVDGLLPALGDVPFEEYVATDSSVEMCGALSDAEIVEMVRPSEPSHETEVDDDDDATAKTARPMMRRQVLPPTASPRASVVIGDSRAGGGGGTVMLRRSITEATSGRLGGSQGRFSTLAGATSQKVATARDRLGPKFATTAGVVRTTVRTTVSTTRKGSTVVPTSKRVTLVAPRVGFSGSTAAPQSVFARLGANR